MNLPEIEMTVHVLRVLEVAVEFPRSENSKVVLVRTTENTGKMNKCIVMRCIVRYPENTPDRKSVV